MAGGRVVEVIGIQTCKKVERDSGGGAGRRGNRWKQMKKPGRRPGAGREAKGFEAARWE